MIICACLLLPFITKGPILLLCKWFAGNIVRSPLGVVHGKSSLVYYDERLDDTLFSGLPK